jgi:hypothetical protein
MTVKCDECGKVINFTKADVIDGCWVVCPDCGEDVDCEDEMAPILQKQKDLLCKDLCGRVPYGVKFKFENSPRVKVCEILSITPIYDYDNVVYFDRYINQPKKCDICDVKPYLFPMSSMTDEQKEEWKSLLIREAFGTSDNVFTPQDFYNKYHLDYRGLIPMGLAEDATGKNVY